MMIEDLTDSVGHYVWLHRQLAESVGSWAAGEADAPVSVYLHGAARRLAQHSSGWEALLADSPALAATERVRAPSPGWEELFRAASAGTSERLVTLLYVVLPRMLDSLDRLSGELGEVAGGAERRFCAIVSEDLRVLEERGRSLLDERAPAPGRRRMAATLGRRHADLSC